MRKTASLVTLKSPLAPFLKTRYCLTAWRWRRISSVFKTRSMEVHGSGYPYVVMSSCMGTTLSACLHEYTPRYSEGLERRKRASPARLLLRLRGRGRGWKKLPLLKLRLTLVLLSFLVICTGGREKPKL